MSLMTEEDEALLRKFDALSTDEAPLPVIKLPSNAATSANLDLSLLPMIVTDKTVQDGPFMEAVRRTWKADPETRIKPVSPNFYIVEFINKDEFLYTLGGGPWTFKGDLVAMNTVTSPSDFTAPHVQEVEV